MFGQLCEEGAQLKTPDEVLSGLGGLQRCSGPVWSQGIRCNLNSHISKCDVSHFELWVSMIFFFLVGGTKGTDDMATKRVTLA